MDKTRDSVQVQWGPQLTPDPSLPVIMALTLRPDGNTGVHTHVRQLQRFLDETNTPNTLVTPFSWGRLVKYPVFGVRRTVLDRFSESAGLAWYRYSHELFLRRALHRVLADVGDCVVYAQDPLAARAALQARRGANQRVVLAVHFRVSQADEATPGGGVRRDGRLFRAIRNAERQILTEVDGLVYVSRWGRDALLEWLPEAAAVPSVVIGNFVEPYQHEITREAGSRDLVTVGRLEPAKNQSFLLHVLAEANAMGRPYTLDVLGDGPSLKELQEESRSLGLSGQVRFLGFRSDVRDILPRYRSYVHASYSESLPLVIIEAMAASLPIVAGDTGGIREMCDEGVEARFWPLSDAREAASILIGLLDDEPVRLQAGLAAVERFNRDFAADVVAPRLRSFLLQDVRMA